MQVSKQMESFAVALGNAYHKRIRPLHSSGKAGVEYGVGGQEVVKFGYYSKRYRFPAVWKNSGARIQGGKLILENHLGNVKLKIKLPAFRGTLTDHHPALIHGDLFGRPGPNGEILRFGATGEQVGVAVELENAEGQKYWEHGTTIEHCHAERDAKIELSRLRQGQAHETEKEQRKLRLLARLSEKVMVTIADAKATGACDAGIRGWLSRLNITTDALPAREVFSLALQTSERQAQAAAIMACRRALQRAAQA